MKQQSPELTHRISLVATGIMILAVGLYFAFPGYGYREVGNKITVTSIPFGGLFFWFGVIAWMLCFYAFSYCIKFKTWVRLLPFIMLVLTPFVPLYASLEHEFDYVVKSKVVDRDGTEYGLFLPATDAGADIKIGKLIARSGFTANYEKLVHGTLELADGNLYVVRRDGSPNRTTLTLTSNRVLVGHSGQRAFVGYDLDSHIEYKFYDMYKLSPFILLGKDDEPSEDDFRGLESLNGFNEADFVIFRRELKNPNPKVRSMAQRLLKSSTK